MKTDSSKLTSVVDWLGALLVASLLLIGHFAPWAAHKTAALTLSANELAVFTHFTPGAAIFLNQWFYLPLWSGALLFASLAAGISSRMNRVVAGLLCVGIASLGMPGYPEVLTAYRSPDYRLQFVISLAVMVVVLAMVILPQVRRVRQPTARHVMLLALAIVSAVPLAGYVMVKPFIEQLYGDALGLGWGWWLTLVAVLLAAAMSIVMRARARTTPERTATA